MKGSRLYSFTILFVIFITTIFYTLSQIENSKSESKEVQVLEPKQKGAHVFGRLDPKKFKFLKETNIDWVTIVTWGFQDNYDSPIVSHHRGDPARKARRDSMYLNNIQLLRAEGFKVFVKPHIWLDSPYEEKWRSDIFPSNEENWKLWKESYRDFILRYATIAEQGKAEMFCIGTELTRLSLEKTEFWKDLISEIRSVFSGKLTYAANWYEEYENIGFWEDLDYIGIQTYFPLAEKKYPSAEEIAKGWQKYLSGLKSIHKKHNRKILFTEMGYKSTANCAMKPWEWIDYDSDNQNEYSLESQANCYRAFFDVVWPEKWFAGVHLWQYRYDHVVEEQVKNLDFTPEGKPANEIIANGFK